MDNTRNIFQRMAAITAELQTVAKNLTVDTGKGKGYKAVSERDIIDAVKPLESKHGVYSYPVMRDTVDAELLETETQYGKKTSFYTRLKTTYRFVNIDEPTDYIETDVFSVGIDSQDKGDGKAMTYGDKYALMKAYKISTGDDPDQDASEENDYKSTPRNSQPKAEKKPFTATCADCGEVLDNRVYEYSLNNYGRPLCRDCQRKYKAFKENTEVRG